MEKPAFKREWIAALRSGKYNQAEEELHGVARRDAVGNNVNVDYFEGDGGYDTDLIEGHCCLGVALLITEAGPSGVNPDNDGMPSEKWCSEWGVPYTFCETLAGLNDGGSSFPEIANYIEENLGG